MQNLSEVYRTNRKYLPLFILAFLALALIIGVYLAQRQQELRSRAAQDTGQLTLNPTVITAQVGIPFSIVPSLLNGGQAVTGADVVVTFDTTKLTLQSITPGTHAIFKTFAPVLPNGTFDITKVIACANTGSFNGSTTNCGGGIGKVDFGIVSFDWKTPPASPGLTSPLPTNTNMSPVATLSFVVKSGTPNGTTDIKIFNEFGNPGVTTQPTTDSNIMIIPAEGSNPEDILQKYTEYSGHTVTVNIGPATGPSPSPTPNSSISPSPSPSPNPISWVTEDVSLQADNFYITIGGQKYYAPSNGIISIKSDPPSNGDPNYTTLEVIWNENGKEMRLFVYFYKDGQQWWSNEIRTYNGQIPGDWINYTAGAPYFATALGSSFTGNIIIASDPNQQFLGTIVFEGLKLQAFLQPTVNPSPTPSIVPVISPSPTPSPSGPIFTLEDLKTVLIQFGGKLDEQYYVDGKINMFDATYVIKYIILGGN